MRKSTLWRGCTVATILMLAALAAGCGSAQPAGTSAHVVNVTEKDFHIAAPTTLAAGEVTFRVHNAGPDEHEFIVIRAADAAALPLQSDGLTIDEAALKKDRVGELVPGAPSVTRNLRLTLLTRAPVRARAVAEHRRAAHLRPRHGSRSPTSSSQEFLRRLSPAIRFESRRRRTRKAA